MNDSAPAPKTKVYFPGLDAMRFFAALLVVFGHIEMLKAVNGFQHPLENQWLMELSRIAVTFFFVLSGFLITYLLIKEKKVSGSISIRNFYIRRTLRIWPIYFLVVFVIFLVLPRFDFFHVPGSESLAEHFKYTFPLHLAVMPQLSMLLFSQVPFAEPLWSIGVEEHFYLLWPLVVKHTRKFLWIAAGIVVAYFLARRMLIDWMSLSRDNQTRTVLSQVHGILYFMRFDCMAVGAIGAWIYATDRKRILQFIYNRRNQLVVYAVAAYLIFIGMQMPTNDHLVYAILFCFLIINVATNPRSLVRFENRAFTFLGKISYSVYMIHIIVIHVAIKLLVSFTGTRFISVTSNLTLYVAGVAATLVVASVLYLFYERAFLRLKSRFTVIPSGAEAREETPTLAVGAEPTLSTGF